MDVPISLFLIYHDQKDEVELEVETRLYSAAAHVISKTAAKWTFSCAIRVVDKGIFCPQLSLPLHPLFTSSDLS